MNKKLIIIIIASVLGIGLVGYVAWRIITAPEGADVTLRTIFPFGQSDISDTVPIDPSGSGTGRADGRGDDVSSSSPDQETIDRLLAAPLIQITNRPIAGAYAFARENATTGSTSPIIRYVERTNGNVREANLENLTVTRLTNTTIQRVYRAWWTETGEGVLLQYLDDDDDTIRTYYGAIVPPRAEAATSSNTSISVGTLEGTFLPENIATIAVAPSGNDIFYLLETAVGSNAFRAKPDGSSEQFLASIPLQEVDVEWPTNNSIILTTKPSREAYGYVYRMNSSSGVLRRIIGDTIALTSQVRADGAAAIWSGLDSRNNLMVNISRLVGTPEQHSVPFQTFAEKCVWSKQNTATLYCAVPKSFPIGGLPDAWYQGRTTFSDSIWRYNTETEDIERIGDLEILAGQAIDAVDLLFDPEERYLYFTNKADSTLWALKLTGE